MWKYFQASRSFYLVATLTGLSFALMGYQNGLFGGLTDDPNWNQRFGYPSRLVMSTIVAVYQLGCLFGCFLTYLYGEALGRKMTIRVGAVIMTGGALLQIIALSRECLIVGRILSGIGLGFISSTAPVLLAEVSPSAKRGTYGCAQLSTLNFGICLSYWINYWMSHNLRGSFTFQVPIAFQYFIIIPILSLTWMIPESPMWLISNSRAQEAFTALTKLRGGKRNEAEIREKITDMEVIVIYEKSVPDIGYKSLFLDDGMKTRVRVLIGCSVQSFQQLGGVNVIVYHAHFMFSSCLGFSTEMSSLISALLFTWFFIASFIPYFLIDTLGRRILMIPSVAIMGFIFAALAGVTQQIEENGTHSYPCSIAAAVLCFVFLAVFAVGFQATVWFYPPEILPQRLRAKGTALSTACNWFFNFVVVEFFPLATGKIGWKTYLIFMALNLSFVPIMYFYYPETKGKTLEEIDLMFGDADSPETRRRRMNEIRLTLAAIQGFVGQDLKDFDHASTTNGYCKDSLGSMEKQLPTVSRT
ncbi:hypothetical protein PCANC_14695 [Puccinia coronata f. sp. avenae]|nr:hypothetical protein PCANC_14695 [Puccinia coronata f. sp. avenae]